mgnify:CR=1 FL=1
MKLAAFARKLALGIGAMTAIGTAWAQSASEISFWVRASDRAFVEPMVKAWNEKHHAKVALTVIPYFVWQNRGSAKMAVCLPYTCRVPFR